MMKPQEELLILFQRFLSEHELSSSNHHEVLLVGRCFGDDSVAMQAEVQRSQEYNA